MAYLPHRLEFALAVALLVAGVACLLWSMRRGVRSTWLYAGAILCLVLAPGMALVSCAQTLVDADSGFTRVHPP